MSGSENDALLADTVRAPAIDARTDVRPDMRSDMPSDVRSIAPSAAHGSVSLRIDRLVLDGFTLGTRERGVLQAALQAELAELLAVGGVKRELLTGTALAGVRGMDIRMEQNPDPGRLGRDIARALHARIGYE